jgi:hypothetical protein
MRIPRTFQNGRASIKTIELILRVSGFLGQADLVSEPNSTTLVRVHA